MVCLLSVDLISHLVLTCCDLLIDHRVSRRLANAAYCIWMVATSQFVFCASLDRFVSHVV